VHEMSDRQDYMRFTVSFDEDVPVLIKMSHFPNWRAYVDGEPTEVYEAGPGWMLVIGHGTVEMNFEPLPVDTISTLVSLVGVVLLLVLIFRKQLKKLWRHL